MAATELRPPPQESAATPPAAAPAETKGGVLPFLPEWLTRNVLIAIVVVTLLLIWLSSGGGGKAESAEGADDATEQDPTVLELVAAVNAP